MSETHLDRARREKKEAEACQEQFEADIQKCLASPAFRRYMLTLLVRSHAFSTDLLSANNNLTHSNLGERKVCDRILGDMNIQPGELSKQFNEEINVYRYRRNSNDDAAR